LLGPTFLTNSVTMMFAAGWERFLSPEIWPNLLSEPITIYLDRVA
jgi:hypothetical protein